MAMPLPGMCLKTRSLHLPTYSWACSLKSSHRFASSVIPSTVSQPREFYRISTTLSSALSVIVSTSLLRITFSFILPPFGFPAKFFAGLPPLPAVQQSPRPYVRPSFKIVSPL